MAIGNNKIHAIFVQYQSALLAVEEMQAGGEVPNLDCSSLQELSAAMAKMLAALHELRKETKLISIMQNIYEQQKHWLEEENGLHLFMWHVLNAMDNDYELQREFKHLWRKYPRLFFVDLLVGLSMCIGYPIGCIFMAPMIANPLSLTFMVVISCLIFTVVGTLWIEKSCSDMRKAVGTCNMRQSLKDENIRNNIQFFCGNEVLESNDRTEPQPAVGERKKCV